MGECARKLGEVPRFVEVLEELALDHEALAECHHDGQAPRELRLGLALAAVVSVIVLAFAWPSVTAEAHELPIAISGPAELVAAAEETIETQQPGAIDFTEVDDRAAAVAAIESREVYGAMVIGAEPEVLSSSASSLVVAQLRELSYFPAADTTFPWLVLAAWAVGGLVLSVIGHFRTAGGAEPDAEAAVAG